MSLESQLGVKTESTYGTPVTVDKFFEFNSAAIKLETGRAQSKGLRAGQKVARSDRFVPYVLGASGSIELDVLDKGFGWWLKHMLGTVGTTGPAETAAYTHTGTIGDLEGTSFTAQVNRALGAGGNTDQAFTYEGGKISKWTLSCEKEGLLTFSADVVFEDQSTATALASASYPAALAPVSWASAAATIAATSVPVTKWSVSVDNKLKLDRHYLANATNRSEPVETDHREITVELEADWSSLTQYNRFASETVAGTLAAVVLTAKGPTLVAGATTIYPGVTVTLPAVRFDTVDPSTEGPDMVMQAISGVGLSNGTDEPISVAYLSADVTP